MKEKLQKKLLFTKTTTLEPTTPSVTLKTTEIAPSKLAPTHKSSTVKPTAKLEFKTATNSTGSMKHQARKSSNKSDLEVLASLLREQREQGRRIEEQLKRLEAANAVDRHRERRNSDKTAAGNDTQARRLDAVVNSTTTTNSSTTTKTVLNGTATKVAKTNQTKL
ncbi:hypothetical protein BOX15_Mlig006217g1 [Macrostomum lignano]|uniref:Uncharacterized protein n=1 Tax=Macrostomum lignano TaxID=282301 RepID=A0A267DTG2_9PLAT|nr:hypothetical protein BOX15_Mlig006217g1 [Macrostomum lignano]